MSRTSDRWVANLSRDGAVRELALSDLREALLRNLRKALSKRTTDDARKKLKQGLESAGYGADDAPALALKWGPDRVSLQARNRSLDAAHQADQRQRDGL